MENLTFGDIASSLSLLVGFIGSVMALYKLMKKWLSDSLNEFLKPIHTEISGLQSRLDTVNMEACKNFLVRCIADFDHGVSVSDTELERFWEQYGYYIKNGGNTYIQRKVEQLKDEGII